MELDLDIRTGACRIPYVQGEKEENKVMWKGDLMQLFWYPHHTMSKWEKSNSNALKMAVDIYASIPTASRIKGIKEAAIVLMWKVVWVLLFWCSHYTLKRLKKRQKCWSGGRRGCSCSDTRYSKHWSDQKSDSSVVVHSDCSIGR